MFSSNFFLTILLASTVSVGYGQRLGKTVLAPDKPAQLAPSFDYLDNIRYPGLKAKSSWNAGHLPVSCVAQADENGCPRKNMKAYAIWYNDCANKAWTFCRCDVPSNPVTLDNMIEVFGKIPLSSRIFVRNFMGIPPVAGGAYAYATGGDIVTFNPLRFVTMLHELTHIIDGANGLSTNAAWAAAVKADSCVISDYANTNLAENLSEVGSLVLLEIVNNAEYRRLAGTLGNFACLSNQLKYAKQVLTPLYRQLDTCPPRAIADGPTTQLVVKRALGGGEIWEADISIRDAEPKHKWFHADYFKPGDI